MDAINRFSNVQQPILSESEDIQNEAPQTPQQVANTGIAGTPDGFENFQQGSFDLSNLTKPITTTTETTPAETLEASTLFDVLNTDSGILPGDAPANKLPPASYVHILPGDALGNKLPPNLGGLTQPIDGKRETYSTADAAFGDADVRLPGELVDKDSLTAPDGDFVEMYLGWEQIPMDRQRGAGTAQEDEGFLRIKDRIRQSGEDKKSEDQKNADETQNQADADRDYTDKQLPDPPKWNDNPSPDGIGGGPAWMGNPEAQRYIHIPGFNGHSNSHGNPSPDGGGEEPTTPGPKKNHGGSGDDDKSSGAAGSDAGNYPFVGEEGTIIHPQVNVGKRRLS